jgi:hypothetical protein
MNLGVNARSRRACGVMKAGPLRARWTRRLAEGLRGIWGQFSKSGAGRERSVARLPDQRSKVKTRPRRAAPSLNRKDRGRSGCGSSALSSRIVRALSARSAASCGSPTAARVTRASSCAFTSNASTGRGLRSMARRVAMPESLYKVYISSRGPTGQATPSASLLEAARGLPGGGRSGYPGMDETVKQRSPPQRGLKS